MQVKRPKTYRKIYYTNQLRTLELDTKFKTIAVRFVVGDDIVDPSNVAILAQGQIDTANLLESFLEISKVYSEQYILCLRMFRMSYSVSFVLSVFPPTVTLLFHQFLALYGFDIDEYNYLFRFVDIEDLWFLVMYYANLDICSTYKAASCVMGYMTSMRNVRINT